MSTNLKEEVDITEIQSTFRAVDFFVIVLAALAGAFAAIYVLPSWIPGISASLTGSDPKYYWYLARGSAFAAYLLLWLSMILGVGITNKLAALWPGLPPTIDLHQYSSILGLVFAAFHGLILLGDHYINFKLVQIFIPFSTTSYKPLQVGLGQLSFYLWILLVVSFYLRKKIGSKSWRVIHYFSFSIFAFSLFHGVMSGSDAKTLWAQGIYWSTGLILLLMVFHRLIYSIAKTTKKEKNKQNGTIPQQ